MTNQERWEYYESGALQRIVAVQLLDWAGYWTTAGLDPIEDDLQREQTRQQGGLTQGEAGDSSSQCLSHSLS